MLKIWTTWLMIGAFAGLLPVGSARADEPGVCSSIMLSSTSPPTTSEQAGGFGPLEEQLFRRIESHSRATEPEAPVFYRSDGDGVALEVAGLSCEAATSFADEQLLSGYIVELSVAGETLTLNMDSVASAARGPTGNLEVRLTRKGRDRLQTMTASNIGREMTVTIEGVGTAETIKIQNPITSGLIQLRGSALPEDLVEDLNLALPVSVDGCVPKCKSGYTWTHDGDQYVYKPR